MYQISFAAALFILLPQTTANANGEPTIPFVDGRWSGDIEFDASSSAFKACWASTNYNDGTTLRLSKRGSGSWHLRLSNPDLQLLPSHQFDMIVLVDFHPQQVLTAAESKSKTNLEIANLDQISLLGLIENGHMINFSSDEFSEQYDLEGSAKVIQRIRNCFADHS